MNEQGLLRGSLEVPKSPGIQRNFLVLRPPSRKTESDNESVPSPTKPQLRLLHVKTLEEIKLDRIQAESAAYYNYAQEDTSASLHPAAERSSTLSDVGSAGGGGGGGGSTTLERTLRARLANRLYTQGVHGITKNTNLRTNLDFQVLSLDEIRKRRRRMPPAFSPGDSTSPKVPRLAENTSSSSHRGLESPETSIKPNPGDEQQPHVARSPRAAATAAVAPPPVRLRRPNRTPAEVSPRKKNPRYSGDQEPADMTSSDSSQEAAAVPDRLTLVASRPSLSARDEREELREGRNAETRLREGNRGAFIDEDPATAGLAVNGGSVLKVSRSISVSSVGEDDYLMMDAGAIDQSNVADDILQDIDELLNDD